MSTQVPVWLDCDPGHDDAFAILLAAYHPNIDLLGISTVFGNATLENTTHNALSILTAIGKHSEIPLHIGAEKALERPSFHAATEIHGTSGLDGTDLLPKPKCAPSGVPAVEAMAEALKAEPAGKAWVVATGCLTNVALLFRGYPELVSHIAGLSLMGGSIGDGFSHASLGQVNDKDRIGNYTPYAEFNILIDPEAAAAIFQNKELARKTSVVPLDLSHQVLATSEVLNLLLHGKRESDEFEFQNNRQKGKTELRQMLTDLLTFFAHTYKAVFGLEDGPPLHDPIAVALVLTDICGDMPFYDWDDRKSISPKHHERFEVTVVTEGSIDEAVAGRKETGRTIAKLLAPGNEGVRIPRGLDIDEFWKVIEQCIERADEKNRQLAMSVEVY